VMMKMKKIFETTIEGKPISKKSAFVGKRGCFKPKSETDWQTFVKYSIQERMRKVGAKMTESPVSILVIFYRGIPKCKKKKYGKIFPVERPDSSRLLLCIEDAMTGVVYRDDAQICDHHIFKRFSERNYVEVSVYELDENDIFKTNCIDISDCVRTREFD
jgi:Holliday junction resolvase RusA-like endonuclease